MELKDTVEWMLSDDWKIRLKAEYWQVALRFTAISWRIEFFYEGLEKIQDDEFELLDTQRDFMRNYMRILEERARNAGIALNDV